MAPQYKVYLFGDQTVDPYPSIRDLYRQSSESLALKAFFSRSSKILRQELDLYGPSDRSGFPYFDSILGLTEAYRANRRPEEAVSTVLLCISQLGLLLA